MSNCQGHVVIKAIDRKARVVKGYFTTENEDREGETFTADMFAETISPGGTYYEVGSFLFNHDPNRVIGAPILKAFRIDAGVGVYGEWTVSDDEIWNKIANGEVRGLSWYGFVDWTVRKVDLVEVTATPVPVNATAILEVKSKALRLGLADESDFPMPRLRFNGQEQEVEGVTKAVYLGPYAEEDVSCRVIESLSQRLWSAVYEELYTSEPIDATFFNDLGAMFDEFKSISLRVMQTLLSGKDRQIVAKSLRETFNLQVQESTDQEEQDVPLTKEEIADIAAATAAAVGGVLTPVFGNIETAMKALVPAALPAVVPPVVVPPTPELVEASKGIVLDDAGINRLADAFAAKLNASPALKGLVTEPVDAAKKDERGQAARKSLVERVKASPIEGPGVSTMWLGHIEDALALEFTGDRTIDEINDSEEIYVQGGN